MKNFLLGFLLFAFTAMPAFAVTHPDEKLRDPALEARALNLTANLRCVVCQNESVDASEADIARDLRLLVRKQILEGKTDAQIMDYLRGRYGDYISFEPPFDARTYLLWLMPLLVLAAGAIFAWPAFKRRRR